jgi:conjugative transposon TraM protein
LGKPVDVKEETQADRVEGADPEFAGQVDRLESMMQMMNNANGEDPEMKQLDGTLDKILDIQHPSRVKEQIKEKSLQHKELVFTVSTEPTEVNVSLLDTMKIGQEGTTGFFGLNDRTVSLPDNNAIEAVVHENQILVNGAVIKFRLLNDVFINGSLIPKGNFVFGTATLHDERLEAAIKFVRCHQSLFPVKLEVYDMDGMPGIYIPGAITRDVAKQSADNSLQLMELGSADPSFKAQAAAAGISTAKSLLSKKIKLIKVNLKAGYKVLLKDNH